MSNIAAWESKIFEKTFQKKGGKKGEKNQRKSERKSGIVRFSSYLRAEGDFLDLINVCIG